MPKESGFAHIIVLLLILAAVVAGGSYLYFYQFNQSKTPELNPQQIRLVQAPESLFLTLESPTASSQVVDDTVLVKGKTLPNTPVVMFNEVDDLNIQSDSNGNFQGRLTLGQGENDLTISAFGDDGSEKTLTVKISFNQQT